MSAIEALRNGALDEALRKLEGQVRDDPADPKLRIFLFQLLTVLGQWDRALSQLAVLRDLDPQALVMAQVYEPVIQCERLREGVFAGQRQPLLFGEPEPWMAQLFEALRLGAAGHAAEAQQQMAEAFEAAPASAGTLLLHDAAQEDEAEGVPFEWIADADTRLGPMLEAVVNGRYYWIPIQRIRQVVLDKPADLRDFVWTPAHFTWSNGGESPGFIPTRYPGSERHADSAIRLARKTDWDSPGESHYWGCGQRILATDADEYPLLTVRRITLSDGA